MFKSIPKVLLCVIVFTSFPSIASDKDQDPTSSVSAAASSRPSVTPPSSSLSLRDIREDSVPAEEEAFIAGVLRNSTIGVNGKDISLYIEADLREKLKLKDSETLKSFMTAYETRQRIGISDRVTQISFYLHNGAVHSQTYGAGK